MKKFLLVSATAIGVLGSVAMTSGASAREVCNDYGRCWHEDTNVGRDIARELLRGRSSYRDRDWDHRHRHYERDYDGPREERYERW